MRVPTSGTGQSNTTLELSGSSGQNTEAAATDGVHEAREYLLDSPCRPESFDVRDQERTKFRAVLASPRGSLRSSPSLQVLPPLCPFACAATPSRRRRSPKRSPVAGIRRKPARFGVPLRYPAPPRSDDRDGRIGLLRRRKRSPDGEEHARVASGPVGLQMGSGLARATSGVPAPASGRCAGHAPTLQARIRRLGTLGRIDNDACPKSGAGTGSGCVVARRPPRYGRGRLTRDTEASRDSAAPCGAGIQRRATEW